MRGFGWLWHWKQGNGRTLTCLLFFSPVERRQQWTLGWSPNREDTQNDLSDATGPLAQTLHYVLWEFMTSGPVKDCHFSQALHRLGKQARNRSDGLSCESATPKCHKPLSLFIRRHAAPATNCRSGAWLCPASLRVVPFSSECGDWHSSPARLDLEPAWRQMSARACEATSGRG